MSKFKLTYNQNAAADVKEAIVWYDDKQKGLGKRFRADVLKMIDKIEQNPFFASVKYSDIRTASCKTFPYSIQLTIQIKLLK